jgi:hypothetical protein
VEYREILASWGVNVPENLSEQDEKAYITLAEVLEDKKQIVLSSFKREKIERIKTKIASMRDNKLLVIPSKASNSENKELLVDPVLSIINDNLFSVF